MTIILTQQELDNIKNNPDLNENIFIKELEKNYRVDFTISANNTIRNKIEGNFPDSIITQTKKNYNVDFTALLDDSQKDGLSKFS